MGDRAVVAVAVVAAVARLLGALIECMAARSAERMRARSLMGLLRLAGPGSVLADQRGSGDALFLRSAQPVPGPGAGDSGGARPRRTDASNGQPDLRPFE